MSVSFYIKRRLYMKKLKLGVSLITLLAVTSLVSCNSNDNFNSSSSAPDSSAAVVEPVLSGVDAKHEFTLNAQNKAKDPSKDDGFYDRTQSYKVGDDNAFNVKPELTVVDAATLLPVDSSLWDYDFTISVTLNGQAVGSEYYSVVDARKCDVKFTEAAVGKTFTISVVPGGIEQSKVAEYTKSITVDVVDGYNVYDAKELGYFDTREKDSTVDAPSYADIGDWKAQWYQFKEANGMDVNLHPAALILQKNIEVTAADLPSNFFYTKEQATSLNDSQSEGSLVDYTFFYMYTGPSNITVEGNYFALDMSKIPLITRESGKTTAEGDVVAHSAAFKAIGGDTVRFQNINVIGNAQNANGPEDKKLSGGFIFVKGGGCKTFEAENIIATKVYITFFGEDPVTPDGDITTFSLNKTKCFNNFNSFLYNWGSTMDIHNSLFRSCGGPIIIQDHTGTKEYEKDNGLTIVGHAPTTNFVDCTLENFVAGTEAWFEQFNVTTLVNSIKSMSDLLGATGLPKSFVVNKNHEGKFYAALAGQESFFNFVALNKSGGSQGATADPACGIVNITKTNKSIVFNYAQPAYDSLYQAYVAYQTAAATGASEQEVAALQQAFGAECVAKGIQPTEEDVTAYITGICTVHGILRALNSAGAPVFELGEAFPLLAYDGKKEHTFLQEATTVAAAAQGQAQPAQFVPSQDQLKAVPDYCSLYYNGMMLVMGLQNYVN